MTQYMEHANVSIAADAPLEMRERVAQQCVDQLIEFLESCQQGTMPTAFYFVSVHPEGDAFRVQHISVGAIEQMAYLLGQAGANVMKSATGGASDT